MGFSAIMLLKLIFISLLYSAIHAERPVTEMLDVCTLCQLAHNDCLRDYANETYDHIINRVLDDYRPYIDQNTLMIFKNVLYYNSHKLVEDVNDHTRNISGMQTCADLGYCDPENVTQPPFNMIDLIGTNPNAELRDARDKSINVLHHTCTATTEETLKVLLDRGLSVQYVVALNGTVYQLIEDWNRAWHAGVAFWGGDGCWTDEINSRAIGIEIVNTGAVEFPQAQLEGVTELVRFLIEKWHINERNIVAHADFRPWMKDDVSGYWNWKWMYNSLGIYPGLFDSKLTPDQQKQVILNNTMQPNLILRVMQQKMIDFGFCGMNVGDPFVVPNAHYDMSLYVEAFNRHFVPELFIKEQMNSSGDNVRNPLNKQFYALTNERLDFLLNNSQNVTCQNALHGGMH